MSICAKEPQERKSASGSIEVVPLEEQKVKNTEAMLAVQSLQAIEGTEYEHLIKPEHQARLSNVKPHKGSLVLTKRYLVV